MATKNENPAPFMAVHPGMMIKPELKERGISQKDFAMMIGVQASHLSEVLNGKRALTTDLAVKIESAIGLRLGRKDRIGHRTARKGSVVCTDAV